MKYLLDTQVWIWMSESDPKLPKRISTILKNIDHTPFGIAAISPWEVAKKVSLGKLQLSIPARDWLMQAAYNSGIEVISLSPEIAWEANHLPGSFHKDPADQLIVASARIHNLILISSDQLILRYTHVKTVWN